MQEQPRWHALWSFLAPSATLLYVVKLPIRVGHIAYGLMQVRQCALSSSHCHKVLSLPPPPPPPPILPLACLSGRRTCTVFARIYWTVCDCHDIYEFISCSIANFIVELLLFFRFFFFMNVYLHHIRALQANAWIIRNRWGEDGKGPIPVHQDWQDFFPIFPDY